MTSPAAYLCILPDDAVVKPDDEPDAEPEFAVLEGKYRPISSYSMPPTWRNATSLQASDFVIAGSCDSEPWKFWMSLNAYGFDIRRSDVGGRSDLTVFKHHGDNSPALAIACARGTLLPWVRLEVLLDNTEGILKRLIFTLRAARLNHFNNFAGDVDSGLGTETPVAVERLNFRFAEVESVVYEGNTRKSDPQKWTVDQ